MTLCWTLARCVCTKHIAACDGGNGLPEQRALRAPELPCVMLLAREEGFVEGTKERGDANGREGDGGSRREEAGGPAGRPGCKSQRGDAGAVCNGGWLERESWQERQVGD